MTKALLTWPAIALYLAAALLLWRPIGAGEALQRGARNGILALAAGAVIFHAALLQADLFHAGLNLGITNAASLVAWAVALLYLLAVIVQPVETLGVLIFPVTATAVLVEWLWPARHLSLPEASVAQTAHIIISLLAYSLLCIAMVQSLALGLQERALHNRRAGGFVRALPPLETMEHLLFRLIAVGFLLLTFTLISGVFFSDEIFGKPLRFTHHIVLSLIGWSVFGVLIYGRWRYGWRGRMAVGWTVAGFMLLVLGYFGSKFVFEVLLGR